jgi:hypothetical protein
MSETEKKMLKCIESLYSVLAVVAVCVDDGRFSEEDGKAINRAFSAYNSAHYDLLHEGVANDSSAME